MRELADYEIELKPEARKAIWKAALASDRDATFDALLAANIDPRFTGLFLIAAAEYVRLTKFVEVNKNADSEKLAADRMLAIHRNAAGTAWTDAAKYAKREAELSAEAGLRSNLAGEAHWARVYLIGIKQRFGVFIDPADDCVPPANDSPGPVVSDELASLRVSLETSLPWASELSHERRAPKPHRRTQSPLVSATASNESFPPRS